MNEKQILETFELVSGYYEKYLKNFQVKAVNLRDKSGKYTKDALVLVYLAKDYPHTRTISKAELTEFVRKFYPKVSDVQQARHLSKQSGYYIISETRGDIGEQIPSGYYKLIDLTRPYPSFKSNRRKGIHFLDFEELKKEYHYKCATCGSIEGQAHNIRTHELTKLQVGHMDPTLPLKPGNVIPQCQVCNRPDRDRWIYDKTGRVVEIADTDKRVVEKYLKKFH